MLSQPLIALLPLLTVVSAAPQSINYSQRPPPSNTATLTTTAPDFTPIGTSYYLQAQPLHETPNALVTNNTYISPYHSGAGTNNVTLSAQTYAAKAFLNGHGGYQEFDLGTPYPWGFVMDGQLGVQTGGETGIKGAGLVNINVGSGDAGFLMRGGDEGLWWNGTGFGGWLACEIEGQTTGLQLFWRNGTVEVPGGCEGVRLVPVSL